MTGIEARDYRHPVAAISKRVGLTEPCAIASDRDAARRVDSRRSLAYPSRFPMDYAVIRSGGKQYRVSPGDTVRLEKLAGEPGASFAFEEVLLASAEGGIQIGKPLITGLKVMGEIVRHERAKKILVFKKKRRKNYRRKQGHRQHLTVVRVTGFERGTEA
jgi:large subunit ribosomal protein L21